MWTQKIITGLNLDELAGNAGLIQGLEGHPLNNT